MSLQSAYEGFVHSFVDEMRRGDASLIPLNWAAMPEVPRSLSRALRSVEVRSVNSARKLQVPSTLLLFLRLITLTRKSVKVDYFMTFVVAEIIPSLLSVMPASSAID